VKKTLAFIIVAVITSISACKPLDPCLNENEIEIKLGDTVIIQACDENAELYEWQLNKEEVNTIINPPEPFYNHYVDSGGTSCDPFISIIFNDTGDFQIRCYFGKLSNGGCSDNLPLKKSEYLNAEIHVRDTAKSGL